jgi:NADP-dependent 3-hydroxy acid dehydrogenase YdfG
VAGCVTSNTNWGAENRESHSSETPDDPKAGDSKGAITMTQKIALVTGGATGIGKATAMILARKGVKVVISGRREVLAQKAIEEIRAQGGEAAFIVANADDEAQVRQIVEFAVKKYGRLDLAVNSGVERLCHKAHTP